MVRLQAVGHRSARSANGVSSAGSARGVLANINAQHRKSHFLPCCSGVIFQLCSVLLRPTSLPPPHPPPLTHSFVCKQSRHASGFGEEIPSVRNGVAIFTAILHWRMRGLLCLCDRLYRTEIAVCAPIHGQHPTLANPNHLAGHGINRAVSSSVPPGELALVDGRHCGCVNQRVWFAILFVYMPDRRTDERGKVKPSR